MGQGAASGHIHLLWILMVVRCTSVPMETTEVGKTQPGGQDFPKSREVR